MTAAPRRDARADEPLQDPHRIQAAWDGAIVDADVHAVVPSLAALRPHLAAQWIEFIDERGVGEPFGLAVAYPPKAPTTAHPAWRPADGRPAASEVSLLREHVLDPLDVEFAVVTCSYGVDSIRHPDFAAALAAAVNDWLLAEWLDADPRLRASLVVPARHPDQMIREIERVGGHPGFVQVLMPVRSDRPYGNRIWHPVLGAIAAHDLVMGLHWGGTSDGPPSPTGWPSWFVEEYAAEQQVYMAQLTSLIGEGAFQAVPGLRVAVGEIGFAWLPSLMWRLQKEWKGLRRDIPWVREPPADLIRRHMRFTVAPLDAGPPDALAEIVEWLGSEDLLMFATDYPHAHELPLERLLAAMPDTMRPRLMAETARELYRMERP
jgi:predicted TIM-barrel fold metal-dependent hydrolase